MDIFLRAKHWQLFLLTFGIPILLEFVFMFSIFSQLMQHPNIQDPAIIFNYFKFFPVIMILFMATLLGWQWSVATKLQKMVPVGVTMKVGKFKIFFFVPVIYLSVIMVAISVFLSGGVSDFQHPETFGPILFVAFSVIFPLHLFSMFCLFYCIYFVAKTYKTVELQREVSFNDFIGEFFLTWFFPIGVWIMQPKINKMIKEYAGDGEDVI